VLTLYSTRRTYKHCDTGAHLALLPALRYTAGTNAVLVEAGRMKDLRTFSSSTSSAALRARDTEPFLGGRSAERDARAGRCGTSFQVAGREAGKSNVLFQEEQKRSARVFIRVWNHLCAPQRRRARRSRCTHECSPPDFPPLSRVSEQPVDSWKEEHQEMAILLALKLLELLSKERFFSNL
jgi:hypothetical protein